MAEFRLGRLKFNWLSEWQPNRAYVIDDIISFRGNTYVCVVNHTSTTSQELWEDTDLNSSPPKWQLHVPGIRNAGAWSPNNFYAKNDVVRYGGNLYICKDNHTSPSDENLFYVTNFAGNWDLFLNGIDNKGFWSSSTWYKLNDLVKYGNNIYICTGAHTSSTIFDITKFDVYLESVKFEDSWTDSVEYQPGDLVLFGGYSYVAKEINIDKQPNLNVGTEWEVITVGFKAQGEYNSATTYVPGDVVTYGGNSFVKLTTSSAGIAPNESGDGAVKWGLISEGLSYKGEWNSGEIYQKHDVVTSGTSTYISLAYDNNNNDPALAGNNALWSLLAAGSEQSTITQQGDLLYRATATNARLPIGGPGQILYATENGIPGWGNNKARKVYFVTLDGVDAFDDGYGQSIGRAFRTVRYATEIATQEGCDEQNPATIYVKAGVYNEIAPIIVPPYCAIVGDDSRGTIIQPDPGVSPRPDGSPANPLSDMQVITIPVSLTLSPGDTVVTDTNKTALLMHYTDAEGSAVGTQLRRRFYIKNLTGGAFVIGDQVRNGNNVSDSYESVQNAVILDSARATLLFLSEGVMVKDLIFNNPVADAGFVPPPTNGIDPDESAANEVLYDELYADITKCNVGFVFFRIAPTLIPQIIIKSPYIYSCAAYSHKGVGAIVDGSVNAGKDHPSHNDAGHQSMLFGNLTQFNEDGVAIWVKDNGNSEVVSSFSYYAHIGYAVSGGGRMRALAGNSSWGNYGCSARGYDLEEIPLEGTVRGSEILIETADISGNFGLGSIISNESALNDTSITQIVGNGTTAIVSFAAKTYTPYELGKKITIANAANSAFNGTFVVTGCTVSSVSFESQVIDTGSGAGGTVRPGLAKAELLYKYETGIYTKLLIEPITGYIGDNTVITQISGTTGSTSAPPSPAPSGRTVIRDGVDIESANRNTRGSKFAVLNLTEKPKITSAVTFGGDARNYVIQEIERYSASPSDFLKIADVTRTSSLTGTCIPIAKTGVYPNGVNVASETHLGGTDVTLYSLLPADLNNPADPNWSKIDNADDALTEAAATTLNVLNVEKVTAALNTYNVPGLTELFLLIGNELIKPEDVVNGQYNSYVNVLRGQEGTIAQDHADQNNETFPENSLIRFVVKHTPVTTLRQDVNDLANSLVFNSAQNNGGMTFFDFTSSPSSPNTLLTINVGDFIKIDNEFFEIDAKTTRNPGSAILTFYPNKLIPESSGTEFFIRYRYSQIRLTGHDMLEIGTGGIATTNFPNEPTIRPRETRETNFVAPARIYYVTTNQDGNFKVGEFFRIDQATGKTNIDASQISLVGIGGIHFGDGGNLVGVRAEKFDPDETLGEDNPLDENIPTQLAVKTYVDNNFLNKNSNATIGSSAQNANLTVWGNAEIKSDITILGNLTVSGDTTTVNTATLSVEDKNIILGTVPGGIPDNTTANGGGITLKGGDGTEAGVNEKTITWSSTTSAWTFSENVDIADAKQYHINAKSVLSSSTLYDNTDWTTIALAPYATSLSVGAATGNTTVNNTLNLSAGTTSKAPLTFGSSTSVLNTVSQGAIEYNNTVIYATPSISAVSGRGLIPTPYIRRTTADKTCRNGVSTFENIFATTAGSSSGGAIPVNPNTHYRFRAMLIASNSSGTGSEMRFAFNTFTATATWTNTSNIITITGVSAGSVTVGSTLANVAGIPNGTRIVEFLSGTEGGNGTYKLSANTTATQSTNANISGTPNTNLISDIQYTSMTGISGTSANASYYNTAATDSIIFISTASTGNRVMMLDGFLVTGSLEATGATPLNASGRALLVPQLRKSLTTGTFILRDGSYFELTPVASSLTTNISGSWT